MPSPRDGARAIRLQAGDERARGDGQGWSRRCQVTYPVILNFANPDMVGHTGVVEAGIEAVETMDGCVKAVVEGALVARRPASHYGRPRQLRANAQPRRITNTAAHATEPGADSHYVANSARAI